MYVRTEFAFFKWTKNRVLLLLEVKIKINLFYRYKWKLLKFNDQVLQTEMCDEMTIPIYRIF